MEIREVREEEFAEAGRVVQVAWDEFYQRGHPEWDQYFRELGDVEARARRTVVLVAVRDDRILGCATLELWSTVEGEHLEGDRANFRMLGVVPEARGRGVGRALVEACIERARGAGKNVCTLHTGRDMVAAQRLYRSMGFERDPERDWRPEDGTGLLAYRLAL